MYIHKAIVYPPANPAAGVPLPLPGDGGSITFGKIKVGAAGADGGTKRVLLLLLWCWEQGCCPPCLAGDLLPTYHRLRAAQGLLSCLVLLSTALSLYINFHGAGRIQTDIYVLPIFIYSFLQLLQVFIASVVFLAVSISF